MKTETKHTQEMTKWWELLISHVDVETYDWIRGTLPNAVDEFSSLTAALDQCILEINNLLMCISLNAPDRISSNDTAIVFARAALATAKKARE